MSFNAALVTGSTSGIGASFARMLPASTDLLLTGRDTGRLVALQAELARPGRRVEVLAVDLAAPGGPERLADAANAFGIDLLVNNAGLGRFGMVKDNPIDAERAMVMTNVVAPLLLTRLLLPGMIERAEPGGQRAGIILVASVVAFAGLPYVATYSATKAFDLRLAEGLTAELRGLPIDVLALCPGTTDTEFFNRSGLRRRGGAHSPDQVAKAGLAALGRRTVQVVGAGNQALTLAFHLLPRGLLGFAARFVLSPR
ncbi:MAG TPA: SDR family NAD(P)-dependent oxidoreductase [Stellaceae bacterium]|nr:SDR family NAD(P)-dependent oxidoreductase [Stellaceae bacterium]